MHYRFKWLLYKIRDIVLSDRGKHLIPCTGKSDYTHTHQLCSWMCCLYELVQASLISVTLGVRARVGRKTLRARTHTRVSRCGTFEFPLPFSRTRPLLSSVLRAFRPLDQNVRYEIWRPFYFSSPFGNKRKVEKNLNAYTIRKRISRIPRAREYHCNRFFVVRDFRRISGRKTRSLRRNALLIQPAGTRVTVFPTLAAAYYLTYSISSLLGDSIFYYDPVVTRVFFFLYTIFVIFFRILF